MKDQEIRFTYEGRTCSGQGRLLQKQDQANGPDSFGGYPMERRIRSGAVGI